MEPESACFLGSEYAEHVTTCKLCMILVPFLPPLSTSSYRQPPPFASELTEMGKFVSQRSLEDRDQPRLL